MTDLRLFLLVAALGLAWLVGYLGAASPGSGESLDVERAAEIEGRGFALRSLE